jgi:hypothetical protein
VRRGHVDDDAAAHDDLEACQAWRDAVLKPGADQLVWRCRQDVKLEVLADGSSPSELGASQARGKRVAVRVIDYRLDDPGRPGEPRGYRLITTSWIPSGHPRRSCRCCIRSGGR